MTYYYYTRYGFDSFILTIALDHIQHTYSSMQTHTRENPKQTNKRTNKQL